MDIACEMTGLDPSVEERAQVRQVLLDRLARTADYFAKYDLVTTAAGFAVTSEDRAQASQAVLGQLATMNDPGMADKLAQAIAPLRPVVSDLDSMQSWQLPPPAALLSAVRQNTGPPARW